MFNVTLSAEAYNAVLSAAAKKDVRYYLNALFIDTTDNPVLVATDGYRLAKHPAQSWEGSSVEVSSEHDGEGIAGILIDAVDLKQVLLSTLSVEIAVDGGKAFVTINSKKGPTTSIHSLVDGRFPDYRRITDGLEGKHPVSGLGINPQYLVDPVAKFKVPERLCKLMGTDAEDANSCPILVTYKAIPELYYIVMPCRT